MCALDTTGYRGSRGGKGNLPESGGPGGLRGCLSGDCGSNEDRGEEGGDDDGINSGMVEDGWVGTVRDDESTTGVRGVTPEICHRSR